MATIDDASALLNSLLLIDRPSITALVQGRVPCTEDLVHHSSITTARLRVGGLHLGLLGVLNGIFAGEGLLFVAYTDETLMVIDHFGIGPVDWFVLETADDAATLETGQPGTQDPAGPAGLREAQGGPDAGLPGHHGPGLGSDPGR